jgi:hypothetical protein
MSGSRVEPAGSAEVVLDQRGRIVAIDLARFLAIVGLMSEHLLLGTAPAAVLLVVTGFPATLFAVLSGASAVISTRRYREEGRPVAAAVSVAARGVMVALLGAVLQPVSILVPVVLLAYGIALIVAAVLMNLTTAIVVTVAIALAVGGPHVIRWATAAQPYAVGELTATDPIAFLCSVFLVGYCPVVTGTVYMLIGVCVGRALTGPPSHGRPRILVITGASMAAAGFVADEVSRSAVVEAVRGPTISRSLAGSLATGTAPPSLHPPGTPIGPGWIAVVNAAPHSGTTADILRTGGVAVLVVAVLLLVTSRIGPSAPRLLRPIVRVGSAPLTVYTFHVLAASAGVLLMLIVAPENPAVWWAFGPAAIPLHVAGALLIGILLTIGDRRGATRDARERRLPSSRSSGRRAIAGERAPMFRRVTPPPDPIAEPAYPG